MVETSTTNTSTGEGILRTVDPTDGLVYVWTSLEPDEARRLWACFDQPDLKAPHRFVVTAPASWLVTSNGAPESIEDAGDARVWTYPDTPRLSTYVVVVNAGPFHEVRQQHDGYDLGFYCRQSLVPQLERDLDEMVTLTRQGLAFFGERFASPFPQERYDQVFVPNLGGAMENWGCVTYGDGQLFRTPPTHAQRSTRAEFIFHEMAHMWFGDLVTMQWWDDLWLNEAFASWAANWGMAAASEFTDQWATFLVAGKRTAYEMDMSPASHPIRGDVADVSEAMANFDAITYVKGQSVLHQLVAYIGEDAFVEGLRDYFSRFAFSNTRLDDLMDCYSRASGRDLSAWTKSWLDEAGPDVISLDGDELVVETPEGQQARPHRLDVAVYDVSGPELRPSGRTTVEVTGNRTPVDLPDGDLRLVNAGDRTYAAVKPDATSRGHMFDRIHQLADPLDRALVAATAGQLLFLGEVAPRDVSTALTRALSSETSPALIEPFLGQALGVADRWAPAAESPGLLLALADAVVGLVELPGRPPGRAPHPGRRPPRPTRTGRCWSRPPSGRPTSTWPGGWPSAAPSSATTTRPPWMPCSPPTPTRTPPCVDSPSSRRVPTSRPRRRSGRRSSSTTPCPRAGRRWCWAPPSGDPARPSCWRPSPTATSRSSTTSRADCSTRASPSGRCIPSGAGDESFLAAAEAAAEDQSLAAYGRNQLRSNSFVLVAHPQGPPALSD